MAILNENIKLMASERLTDEEDGGGRMTGNEVVDGEVNNLFPDISRLDRVYGRVNLRKAFLFVDTANTDVYYGAHAIIEDAPDDPNVGVCLFSTESHIDERANARDRIESFVTQGPESDLRPLGDQLTGQRSITLYQRPDGRLPEIGEVYVLSIEDSGHPDNGTFQYVRIQDVASEVRTFTQAVGSGFVDFDARVVTLSLTTELRHDFPGKAPTRDFSSAKTKIRTTQVANAAKYYGIKPLVEPAAVGDTQLVVSEVYHPLVPATQVETPQVDIDAGATVAHEETSGTETVEVADTAHTDHDEVTIQNRGLAWVKNLRPLPAPGTTVVEFRALGKWYRIKDRGDGKLEGDGAGTVDYATGSVSVTLAAQPDVGSAILYSWGTVAHYYDRSGDGGDVEVPAVTLIPSADIRPGSVTVSWEGADGLVKTATDDGVGGLSGDGTGRVIYSGIERRVELHPSSMPAASTQYELAYEQRAAQRATFNTSTAVANNTVSFTLPDAPIAPGSVTLRVPMTRLANTADGSSATQFRTTALTDDGVGGLVFPDGTPVPGGSINYSTGAVTFDCRRTYERRVYVRSGTY